MRELEDFQPLVLEVAHLYGWRHLHVRRSIGKGNKHVTATNVPWPDLTMWHPGRGGFLIRELKVPRGKDGQIAKSQWKPGQLEVIEELSLAGVDVDVWTPAGLDDGSIVAELNGRRGAKSSSVHPFVSTTMGAENEVVPVPHLTTATGTMPDLYGGPT